MAPKKAFPAQELKAWLKKHPHWNHDEWLSLLHELRQRGFAVDSKKDQDSIGLFLETNKGK